MNKALLAKQAWRLVTDPEALWVEVLKGKYFSGVPFWSAQANKQASSWILSSLLEGRDALQQGCI